METTEKSVEVLNDLIEINNDRVAGFKKAANDLDADDIDLKAIFEKYAEQSASYSAELTAKVNQFGGEATTGSGIGGGIHRAWIDVKAVFSGHDRKSVLEECERGEDAIKKSYKDALMPENDFTEEVITLLGTQQQGITEAHNAIKALRDSQF